MRARPDGSGTLAAMSPALASLAPLAHSGPGASWQALLFVLTLGVTVLGVLAWLGRVRVDTYDDLVLPFAGIAIASSIAPVADEVLSDLVGWFLPTGVAALVVLLVYAARQLSPETRRNLGTTMLGIGVVGSVVFGSAIGRAVHPPAEDALFPDDVVIAVVAPEDDAVASSPVEVVVEVTGGTVVATEAAGEQLSDDPEELGFVVLFLDGRLVETPPAETCSADAPCTSLTWTLEVEPGEHRLDAEFRPNGGRLFTQAIFDTATFAVEG